MSAPTPGPWKKKRVPETSGGKQGALVYFKLQGEGVTVAGTSVYVGKTDGATRMISAAECEANADLIAAAPDLLAALERVVAEASKPTDPDAERWDHDISKPHHWVQLALAKARGGGK